MLSAEVISVWTRTISTMMMSIWTRTCIVPVIVSAPVPTTIATSTTTPVAQRLTIHTASKNHWTISQETIKQYKKQESVFPHFLLYGHF